MATYSAILSNGTTIIVSSGTTSPALNVTALNNGDTLYVQNGATVSGITANLGGVEVINSGGTNSDGTINSGGALYVSGGGVTYGETISGTGYEEIMSGGSATSDVIAGSGFYTNLGGNKSTTLGAEVIDVGGTASNDYISSGGVLGIDATSSGTGKKTVISGGTLQSVYVASGGEIVLSGWGTDAGNNVTVNATSITSGAYSGDYELTAYRNGSAFWSTTLTGIYTSENVSIQGVPQHPIIDLTFGTGTTNIICFLEGTMIQGGTVEKAVEELQPGDMVDTLVDGEVVQKPVKWVGSRSVTASQMPEEDAHPVRVRANAFGPGMPQRDLLITPEHCVFVDGRLTPIRMLVNGGSILVDRSIGAYTYYHVELEQHGILLAEGLATESYLDTGNRGNFANTDVPAMRPNLDVDAGHASWETDAAAPLAVDRATVEPVWRRLAERAAEIGFAPVTAPAELVADHDLRLVTDEGWEIRPARHAGDRYSFMVPDGVSTLRLRSRAARPSEVVGPFVDDRRKLGVKIGEIRLLEGRQQIGISSHLGGTGLRGWHAIEAEGDTSRWTNGDAELPIALGNGPTLVEIQVVAGGPYLPEIADEAVALAG